MRVGSAPPPRKPAWRWGGYVGRRRRKRLSDTPEILRNGLRCSQTHKRIYLSKNNDTAQRSGFLSGAAGRDTGRDTNLKSADPWGVWSGPFLPLLSRKPLLFFPAPGLFKAELKAAVWQRRFGVTPEHRRLLGIGSNCWKRALTGSGGG